MTSSFSVYLVASGLALSAITFAPSANAQAQQSCQQIFEAPSVPRSILELMTMTPEQDRSFERVSSEYYHSANKLELVQQTLAKLGVPSEIIVEPQFFGLFKSTYVRILPMGDAYLNKLAARMYENYGTALTFDPNAVKNGTVAAFSPSTNRIYLSEFVALTGRGSEDLFHEIKHAALTARERNKRGSLISGYLVKIPGTAWPWGKSKSAYKNVLSLQEVLTWSLGAEYYMRAYARGEVQPMATSPSRETYASARGVYEDARAALQYHLELADKEKIKASYTAESDTLSLLSLNWNSIANYEIPASFFRPRLPEAPRVLEGAELKKYLRTSEGRQLVKQIIKDYFAAFDRRLAAIEQRAEKFRVAESEAFLQRKEAKLKYYDQVVMQGRHRERSGEMDRGFYIHKDIQEYPPELQQRLREISRDVFTRHGFLTEKALPQPDPGA